MSGPKVVRIITVEEVQATCRRLMRQVDSGAEELRRLATRLNIIDTALDKSLAGRAETLSELYAAGRLTECQKLAEESISSYPNERERLHATATAAAEAARSRRRRLADSARTVAEALRAAGEPVPSDLAAVISRSAMEPDSMLEELERQVETSFSAIRRPEGSRAAARDAAQALAGRLGDSEATLTLAEWVSTRVRQPTVAEQRLDRLVAEIGTLDPREALALSARIASIEAEDSNSQRKLLTDSLVLKYSARVAELRNIETAAAELREASALLAASSSDAAVNLRTRIDRAAEGERTVGAVAIAVALVAEANSLIAQEEKKAAATARRHAVLSALSTLGYEVRETMEQTWLRDGRVVLRKPGTQDYGVEIGAPTDVERLQVRVVGSDRPGQPRTAKRDAEQEATWCGEFDRLKDLLMASGGDFRLERAIQVGVQPVRTVTLPAVAETGTTIAERPHQLRR
jgi:hypothetical protein